MSTASAIAKDFNKLNTYSTELMGIIDKTGITEENKFYTLSLIRNIKMMKGSFNDNDYMHKIFTDLATTLCITACEKIKQHEINELILLVHTIEAKAALCSSRNNKKNLQELGYAIDRTDQIIKEKQEYFPQFHGMISIKDFNNFIKKYEKTIKPYRKLLPRK